MSASVSGHRAARRANLRSSFRLEFRLRPRSGAIVSYPGNERAVVHDSYDPCSAGGRVEKEGAREGAGGGQGSASSPVVLDVEVLRGDGRVDGVVETLGRRDLVV